MSPLDNTFGWVATLFVVIALFADLRHDIRRLISGRSVVLVGILCWYLLEAVKLSPVLDTYSQATYNLSVFYVVVATIAFLAGYHLTTGCRYFDPLAHAVSILDDRRMLWALVSFCALIGFAPVAVYSGLQIEQLLTSMMGMRSTWGGLLARGRYGDFRAAMLEMENFLVAASPFAFVLLLDRRSSLFQKTVCALVCFWPVLRAYGSGTRSASIGAILPILAVFYFRSSDRTQRLLIYLGIASTPFVFLLMAAIVASRNSGELDISKADSVTYVGNEMLQELAYITENFPQHYDYLWGYNYYVQLVNPIPRFIWNDKPSLDSGLLLAELKGDVNQAGEATMTNSPGLLGEMYMNFGPLGILALSFFGGWLVRGWDNIPRSYGNSLATLIFYCMGLAILFVMGRSFNMSTMYAVLFLCAGLWIIRRFIPAPAAKNLVRSAAPIEGSNYF